MSDTHADFSQNDPRWKSHLIGFTTSETMGLYGCLIDAAANVITAQGDTMTPDDVNNALKARGDFVKDSLGQIGDVAGYSAIGSLSPHTHFVEQKSWPANVVAPIEYFDVGASVTTEVIVEIDYHPETSGEQSHYCRVIGVNAARNDVEILDSYTGQRVWLSSIASKGGKKPLQIIWGAGKFQQV